MLVVTALAGGWGFAGVSAAQPSAGQPGGSGSISFPPGEQLSTGSDTLVAPSGSAGGSIHISANCPEPSPPPTLGNFWGIQVGLQDQYGHGQGNDYFVGPNSPTYTNTYPFTVTLPQGVKSDTWNWTVTLGCDGESMTIGSGSFTVERCDPDAYQRAQSEYEAAERLERAADKDLIELRTEVEDFVKDYVKDSAEIVPEKLTALDILQRISEKASEYGEVGGVVLGVGITATQLELLGEHWAILSDSAEEESNLAKKLRAQAKLDFQRALTGGCPDTVHNQIKKIEDEADLTEKAQALIDTWQNNGYLYVSPITHEVVDETTALKQAKAALTSGNPTSHLRAQDAARRTPSVKATASQLRTAIRYLDDALRLYGKARHQLDRLQDATAKAVTALAHVF